MQQLLLMTMLKALKVKTCFLSQFFLLAMGSNMNARAVYRLESGSTIRIMIQELRFNIYWHTGGKAIYCFISLCLCLRQRYVLDYNTAI